MIQKSKLSKSSKATVSARFGSKCKSSVTDRSGNASNSIMGCVHDPQSDIVLSSNAEREVNEEKACRPHPSSTTAATQTTQTVPNGAGALQINGQHLHSPPNQSPMNSPDVAVNSNVHQRRNPRSALNNFQSANEMEVVLEDHDDDCNQTRNQTPSIVSGVTDMSTQTAHPPIGTHSESNESESDHQWTANGVLLSIQNTISLRY